MSIFSDLYIQLRLEFLYREGEMGVNCKHTGIFFYDQEMNFRFLGSKKKQNLNIKMSFRKPYVIDFNYIEIGNLHEKMANR